MAKEPETKTDQQDKIMNYQGTMQEIVTTAVRDAKQYFFATITVRSEDWVTAHRTILDHLPRNIKWDVAQSPTGEPAIEYRQERKSREIAGEKVAKFRLYLTTECY